MLTPPVSESGFGRQLLRTTSATSTSMIVAGRIRNTDAPRLIIEKLILRELDTSSSEVLLNQRPEIS
jgi:hypothetical protein